MDQYLLPLANTSTTSNNECEVLPFETLQEWDVLSRDVFVSGKFYSFEFVAA